MAPRGPHDGPSHPRRPKRAPGRPKKAPRRPKRPPIWPQEGAQTGGATGHFEPMAPGNPHKAPWVSKRPPMRLPRSHKKPQEAQRKPPRGPKGAPRGPKTTPKTHQNSFQKAPETLTTIFQRTLKSPLTHIPGTVAGWAEGHSMCANPRGDGSFVWLNCLCVNVHE